MLRLPAIISDGMVAEKNGKIWGTADCAVDVTFNGTTGRTYPDRFGKWEYTLPDADFGGPYALTINDKTINDVHVGYVWLCSGQSNMEMPVHRVRRRFKEELKGLNRPTIRAFNVRPDFDFQKPRPFDDNVGVWWRCEPSENNPDEPIDWFYAAGLFMAMKLQDELNVPIGIIGCAQGGSTAESWISERVLRSFPEQYDRLRPLLGDGVVAGIQKREAEASEQWHNELNAADKGAVEHWETADFNDADWGERVLTDKFEDELSGAGAFWFRKTITLSKEAANAPATLNLGRIKDESAVYVNGQFAGGIGYQYPPSVFKLNHGVLREGDNVIAVRVTSDIGDGYFDEEKVYRLESETGNVDLSGTWKYKVGTKKEDMAEARFFPCDPVGLYNAMLSPVIGYTVSGAAWYQGESNSWRNDDYVGLMTALAAEWRAEFNQKLPFIIVQLPNYRENGTWGTMRQKQIDCLSIGDASLVAAIDCGESTDLHPTDKKTVGTRIANAALRFIYGKDAPVSPIATTAARAGDMITVYFGHAYKGLTAKGAVNVELVDDNGGVHSREGVIDGAALKIDVSGLGDIREVRYCYDDDPPKGDITLFGGDGEPAACFAVKLKLG